MFGTKKKNKTISIDDQLLRKMLHDLRASHHAAKLNAEAAHVLATKTNGRDADRLSKHLAFLNGDLDKLKNQLEELTRLLKRG